MKHGHLTSKVRRWAAVGTIAVLATIAVPAPAYAEEPKPGDKQCEVTDPLLGELSGLVARDEGYAAIGDGSDGDVTTVDVIGLDDKCQNSQDGVSGQVEPSDPEDLALDSDGAYWVADIGDNQKSRPTIAVHKITSDGTTQTFRFAYPGGKKYDAEAMLLSGGTPIFATKEIGKSTLFAPDGELNPDSDTPTDLKKVAAVKIKATKTGGGPEEINGIPLGKAPSMFVTGGAVSADGKKAVLRTYTDAYEWSVKGKDVGKSISDGKPAVTPLPDEPQGEAITYSSDGKKFITGSEAKVNDGGTVEQNPTLWSYKPAKAAGDSGKKKDSEKEESGDSLTDTILNVLGVNGILWAVGGIGVIGLIMVIIGVRVIYRTRKKKHKGHSLNDSFGDDDGEEPPPSGRQRYSDESDGFGGGRLFESGGPSRDAMDDDWRDEPRSGSVYGSRHDEPGSGRVYGGRGGYNDEPGTGTVYGGRH